MSCIRPYSTVECKVYKSFSWYPATWKACQKRSVFMFCAYSHKTFLLLFFEKTHYFRTPYPLFSYICKISNYIDNYTLKWLWNAYIYYQPCLGCCFLWLSVHRMWATLVHIRNMPLPMCFIRTVMVAATLIITIFITTSIIFMDWGCIITSVAMRFLLAVWNAAWK